MSFVIAAPSMQFAAAENLTRIGNAIGAANTAVAGCTTAIEAAAADEVSEAIAALFGRHAQSYQELSVTAESIYGQFVQTLYGAGAAYGSAESVNAQQILVDLINAPTQILLGRPLIGNGIDGVTVGGVGQAGGAGGLLYGNGGNGGASTASGAVGGRGGDGGLIGTGGIGGTGGLSGAPG
ncbi:PE family protein, partial [Mycobacterium gordonae]|uniref:PE family protein n=1 Tax=Mycobacterium gordonae TaxID=1778 RepID=UPI001153B0E5